MITLSNLRKETIDGWTRILCDCDNNVCGEDTIWFAVPEKNKDFFQYENYDAFLTGILYTAMYFKEDVLVRGKVSKELYRNMTKYIMSIFESFSPDLKRISIIVDDFCEKREYKSHVVGTGFSAGIDSFSTIVDYMVDEYDPEYKINTFFFFNVGSHGLYSDPISHKKFLERYELLKKYPLEKGIPFIPVDSNVHAYHEIWGHMKTSALTLISAILALQGNLSRYYIASALSYEEMNRYSRQSVNFSLAEYSETYLYPLFSNESIIIVPDGNQYTRTGKTQNIVKYQDTYKYLNVCVTEEDTTKNCSCCSKCLRTLMALESMDMLDSYSDLFDLEVYNRQAFRYKCKQRLMYRKDAFAKDNVDFARENGKHIPSYFVAFMYCLPDRCFRVIRIIVKNIIGDCKYEKLKAKMKRK